MADKPSEDERRHDERSLEIQAQIESEARRIAWGQTYGQRREKKVPMRRDRDQLSPKPPHHQPAVTTLRIVNPPEAASDIWAKFADDKGFNSKRRLGGPDLSIKTRKGPEMARYVAKFVEAILIGIVSAIPIILYGIIGMLATLVIPIVALFHHLTKVLIKHNR